MALLAGLAAMGLLIYGAWRLIVSTESRRTAAAELAGNPLASLIGVIGVGCFVAFFAGILIPAFGEITVAGSGREAWKLWQVGGIGFAAVMILAWTAEALRKQ